jgi:hypothetical protein
MIFGLLTKRDLKHKEIIALYNGIKVFVMRGASSRRALYNSIKVVDIHVVAKKEK